MRLQWKETASNPEKLVEFYRYNDYSYGYGPSIQLEVWYLHTETPCGYWVKYSPYDSYKKRMKWVSKDSRKRFAYPTKEQAWENFKARKYRQLELLESQVKRIKEVIAESHDREKKGAVG